MFECIYIEHVFEMSFRVRYCLFGDFLVSFVEVSRGSFVRSFKGVPATITRVSSSKSCRYFTEKCQGVFSRHFSARLQRGLTQRP
ncbi:hypothetical protein [Yersinia phage vB_YenM_P778]